jgi:hypothetical protein
MPTNKDFKRVVRARMKKTGESYTAARSQLVRDKPTAARTARRAAPSAIPYAELAGMSDASVEKATGCKWERWVRALDRVEAHSWPHGKIADYVHTKYKVPDWLTQTVTVGYERIKGLRVRGQRRDGSYEASKSKVIAAPVRELYDAFSDPKKRARWLVGVTPEIRSATKNKSMRLRWPDGSAVDVGFYDKGVAKGQVTIGHRKLPSQAEAASARSFWSERLAALADLLAAPTRRASRPPG